MARQDDIEMHAGRALAELECARGAACEEAAFAHLALSELHLARLRIVREAPMPALRLVQGGKAEPIIQVNQKFRMNLT